MSHLEAGKQREALCVLFKATGGRPPDEDDRLDPGSVPNTWKRRKNWASQKDPGDWEGVVTEWGHDPEGEPDVKHLSFLCLNLSGDGSPTTC